MACNNPVSDKKTDKSETYQSTVDLLSDQMPSIRALLASRFETFDAFKQRVLLTYTADSTKPLDSTGHYAVEIRYQDRGQEIVSVLESGIHQGKFLEVRDGDMWDRVALVYDSPFAIANRVHLNEIYKLARRRPSIFGEGDVAFYDLALISNSNISTKELAFKVRRDSSEKGYINTFNHMTAQALITTIYSEELADFVASVHERYYMPELVTGEFTEEQLLDSNNNPVDNYVDIINNEIGQEMGKYLKVKYGITTETEWTPILLARYLNDLHVYYSWAFGMGMKPISADDETIIKFAKKINTVKLGVPYILD